MTSFPILVPILISAIVAIPTLILCGAYRALVEAGKPAESIRRSMLLLGPFLFGWLALAVYLGSAGAFRSAVSQPFPYIGLAILGPIILGSLLMLTSKTVQEIIGAVPQGWLVGFQVYRIAGVIFLVLYAGGLLPGVFAIPAGYGDLLVGLSAIAIGAVALKNRLSRVIALWNWLGILDLAIAVATGFLTAPSRYQLLSRETPNLLIGSFPLVMIPIYLVPISILLHLASLSKLRQTEKVDSPQRHGDTKGNGSGLAVSK
jgi:hypothetical protein